MFLLKFLFGGEDRLLVSLQREKPKASISSSVKSNAHKMLAIFTAPDIQSLNADYFLYGEGSFHLDSIWKVVISRQ